jgi:von Willebrand factor type A domain
MCGRRLTKGPPPAQSGQPFAPNSGWPQTPTPPRILRGAVRRALVSRSEVGASPQTEIFMARKQIRLLTVLAALSLFYVVRSKSKAPATPEAPPPDTAATGLYKAAAQEGLGASVAILLDQSGSMDNPPESGGDTPKFRIAREAIAQVLAQTDSFVAKQPGFPVNVGLYVFDSRVRNVLPISRYSRDSLQKALEQLPDPDGSTAIGEAMLAATHDLYAAGTFRKYLLVLTDGENTSGREPDEVAREIARRSEGSVKLYLVAFDVDAAKFAFVNDVRGSVLQARNALGLRASLDTLYRGRILAEAVDAGETLRPDSSTSHLVIPQRPKP